MHIKIIKNIFGVLLVIASIFLFTGCLQQENTTLTKDRELKPNKGELVIYSARKEKYVKPLVDRFEKETGIKVKLLASDETLVQKVLIEKNNYADIFFSTDVGTLEYLRIKGALMPYETENANAIFDKYRTEDDSWFPLGARCRVLMYNKDLITEEEMPKNLWELTDPKWKGQFMIPRGGNGSMLAHITALRTIWGDEKTKQWLQILAENAGAITSDHAAIREAIGAGEYKIGLVNDNYFYQQLIEKKNNNVGIIYPDQGPDGMGVFVNVSGAGIVKNAPNLENAKMFMEFILEPEQLKLYDEIGAELPVSKEVEHPEFKGLKKLGEFKEMEAPFSKIGLAWRDVKKLVEEAGLDLNIQK